MQCSCLYKDVPGHIENKGTQTTLLNYSMPDVNYMYYLNGKEMLQVKALRLTEQLGSTGILPCLVNKPELLDIYIVPSWLLQKCVLKFVL